MVNRSGNAAAAEEEGEEDGQGLVAINIDYKDPQTGSICSKVVYGDKAEWKGGYQSRFLISSNLINMLQEAQQTRSALFTQSRDILDKCRSGYLAALYRLREMISAIVEKVPADDLAGLDIRNGKGDFLPVHFYYPEIYWDMQTEDAYQDALAKFKVACLEEIKFLGAEIAHLGGSGGWYPLLKKYLEDSGEDLVSTAMWFMGTCEDDAVRKEIVEKLIPGVWDKHAALERKVEALEEQLKEREQELPRVTKTIENRKMQIPELNQQIQDLKEALQKEFVPPEVKRKPKPQLTEEEKRQRRNTIFSLYAGELAEVNELVETLRFSLAEWELKRVDSKQLAQMEQTAKEAEKKNLVGRKRIQAVDRKTAGHKEKLDAVKKALAEAQKEHDAMKKVIANAGPIDPKTLKLVKLKRELKELIRDTEKCRRELIIPINKVKAIRYALRKLYKKLGWDWDLSDSEDEGEDKPYWVRRKLAKEMSLVPFDEGQFLFEEKDFHKRRQQRRTKKERSSMDSTITAQMAAKRCLAYGGAFSDTDTTAGGPSVSTLFDESSILPFTVGDEDPIESALRSVRRRLIIDRDELELPKWVHDAAALEAKCRRAVQLQELRGALEAQLRQCAACFLDQLPAEGALGDLRLRLSEALERLHGIPVDASTWQDSEQEQELEHACQKVHAMIEEAIHISKEVQPISLALQHSVEFSELWSRLTDVRLNQFDMRADVEAIAGKGYLMRANSRIMSVRRDEFEEQRLPSPKPIASGFSSPRIRTPLGAPAALGQQGPDGVPRLDVLSETLMSAGGTGTRYRRRETTCDVVDFGFRPDGGGEESLENWSLFKVSRGGPMQDLGGGRNAASTASQSHSSGMRHSRKSDKRPSDKKVQRYQKLVGECDFREYMAQQQAASSPDLWKSSSAPDLLGKRKGRPKLPELVRAEEPSASPPPRGGSKDAALLRDHSAASLGLARGIDGSSRW